MKGETKNKKIKNIKTCKIQEKTLIKRKEERRAARRGSGLEQADA